MNGQANELRAALDATGWNVSETARRLGLSRQAVYDRMRKLKVRITPAERRATISEIRRRSVSFRRDRRGAAA
jgi:DNA-binding Lrp family transcriptional regulator